MPVRPYIEEEIKEQGGVRNPRFVVVCRKGRSELTPDQEAAIDAVTECVASGQVHSAEVQLRRLYSVCLAAKLGSYKLSQHLEELPGEGALAELPASILREMSEALKLELKIEQLVKG